MHESLKKSMTLTPEQFRLIATKEDLKDFVTKKEFEEKTDKIITAIDNLTKKVTDFQDELTVNQSAHDRMDKSIIKLGQGMKMLGAK